MTKDLPDQLKCLNSMENVQMISISCACYSTHAAEDYAANRPALQTDVPGDSLVTSSETTSFAARALG